MAQETLRRSKDLPLFDEKSGLTPEAPAAERAHDRLTVWSEHRDDVIKRIRSIADELDKLKRSCDVSTVVGSSVGIAGGAAVIGGLVFAPPIAIGGLVVGGLAAASNITTSLIKVAVIKKRAAEVLRLVQRDEELHSSFQLHLDELLKETDSDVDDEEMREDIEDEEEEKGSTMESLARNTEMATSVSAAVATGVSAAGARAAILETSRLAPTVVKGIAHGAAGLGIVIDTLTLIMSSRDLIKGAHLEYAIRLREVACQLKQEMHTETAQFVKAILVE